MADKTRRRLDTWHFWVGVAYVGLALVTIWLLVTYLETGRNTTERRNDERAQQIQAVASCFSAVANSPVVFGFINGQGAIIQNGIDSNQALLDADHLTAREHRIRVKSLARLKKARSNNNALDLLFTQTTPTKRACISLAVKTHVAYQEFLPKPAKPKPAKGTTKGSK